MTATDLRRASLALAREMNPQTVAEQARVIADKDRQIYRLQKQLSEAQRKVNELTILRHANTETMLAVLSRREDFRKVADDHRLHETVIVDTDARDYTRNHRPATVTLDMARGDGLFYSLAAWFAHVLTGSEIEFIEVER